MPPSESRPRQKRRSRAASHRALREERERYTRYNEQAQAQVAALTADIATVLRWARPADGLNKTDPSDYNAATAVIDRWAAQPPSTPAADTRTGEPQ